MSDPAIRPDVIAALRAQPGVVVNELAGNNIEVIAVGEPNRVFELGPVVSRGLLWDLQRWYHVPIGAFFPPFQPRD